MSLQSDTFSSKDDIVSSFINAEPWPLTFVHMPAVLFLNTVVLMTAPAMPLKQSFLASQAHVCFHSCNMMGPVLTLMLTAWKLPSWLWQGVAHQLWRDRGSRRLQSGWIRDRCSLSYCSSFLSVYSVFISLPRPPLCKAPSPQSFLWPLWRAGEVLHENQTRQ